MKRLTMRKALERIQRRIEIYRGQTFGSLSSTANIVEGLLDSIERITHEALSAPQGGRSDT